MRWPSYPVVYLIVNNGFDRFKVGMASNLLARMKAYATHGADVWLMYWYGTAWRGTATLTELASGATRHELDIQWTLMAYHKDAYVGGEWWSMKAYPTALACLERVRAERVQVHIQVSGFPGWNPKIPSQFRSQPIDWVPPIRPPKTEAA